jgi:predicted secreted protein
MATVTGYSGSLRDSSGNKIGELTAFTLTITQNSEQFNSFGNAWTSTAATTKNWSVEGSGNYDPDDTYQTAIVTEVLTGDADYSIIVRAEGDEQGDDVFSGSIKVTEVSIEASADGLIAFSFSGDGDGTLTKGAVS